jgi:hypothetical protein
MDHLLRLMVTCLHVKMDRVRCRVGWYLLAVRVLWILFGHGLSKFMLFSKTSVSCVSVANSNVTCCFCDIMPRTAVVVALRISRNIDM